MDISNLGLEIVLNPIKKVRLQFHGGKWYVEYRRKPKYFLDRWWWFDDSTYSNYIDAVARAHMLAAQGGTESLERKTEFFVVNK
jgi:hypothetical protein